MKNQKFYIESQKSLNCQRNIEKKTKTGDTILSAQTIYEEDKSTNSERYMKPIFYSSIIYNIQDTVVDLDIFYLLTICFLLWIWFWSPRKYNASFSFAHRKQKTRQPDRLVAECRLHYFLAIWPCTNHFPSLSFIFILFRMESSAMSVKKVPVRHLAQLMVHRGVQSVVSLLTAKSEQY